MSLFDEDSVKKSIKKVALTGVVIASALLSVAVITSMLKDGILDAAAQDKYETAKEEIKSEDGSISFTALKLEGSEAKDWIQIEGTGIDYPLMQGGDNSFYLNHDAFGNESKAGAIFVNCLNSKDLTDNKTIIFGHNLADGTMFTELHNYSNPSWGNEHTALKISSADGSVRDYKLLCYIYTVPDDDTVYVTSYNEPADEVARALLDEADIQYSDYEGGKLLCLSTCKSDSTRSVVVFELSSLKQGAVSGESVNMRWAVTDKENILPEGADNTNNEGDSAPENSKPLDSF